MRISFEKYRESEISQLGHFFLIFFLKRCQPKLNYFKFKYFKCQVFKKELFLNVKFISFEASRFLVNSL